MSFLFFNDDLFKSSGLLSLFKNFIFTSKRTGSKLFDYDYESNYSVKVAFNPHKGFLDSSCIRAMEITQSIIDGRFYRELTQFYRTKLRNEDYQEAYLGKRLSLLLRSYIKFCATGGSKSASSLEKELSGTPLPKICVWILQMTRVLTSNIELPYSNIQVRFTLQYVERGDEIDNIFKVINELGVYGKIFALATDSRKSAIVVTSRVLTNKVPGTLCAVSTATKDSNNMKLMVDTNAYAHDVYFNILLGTYFVEVERDLLSFQRTSYSFSDGELHKEMALFIINAMIGNSQQFDIKREDASRYDLLSNMDIYVGNWDDEIIVESGSSPFGSNPKEGFSDPSPGS